MEHFNSRFQLFLGQALSGPGKRLIHIKTSDIIISQIFISHLKIILPAVRFGRNWLVPVKALEEWLIKRAYEEAKERSE